VPRVKCTFAEFIRIIETEGFVLHRHGSSSHRRYRGIVDGQVRFVDVAYHRVGDVILPKTLASMIRQCGLSKDRFQK
jgi:predicted RNA binding protein YcfA (HicA-like mRNA interferase family)